MLRGLGLKNFMNRLFVPMGLELRKTGPLSSLPLALKHLAGNRPIQVVYDIGAHKGEWSYQIAKTLEGNVAFHLFEPNLLHKDALEEKRMPYYSVLLSKECSAVDFFSNGSSGDSIFRERSSHYAEISPRTIRSHTLDCLVEKNSLPLPDLIKIDTQGSELEIIRGAPKTIRRTRFIFLELPVVSYNAGAPGFQEYIDLLAQSGFAPFGLFDVHNVYGMLVQVDILFVKIGIIAGTLSSEEAQTMNSMLGYPTT